MFILNFLDWLVFSAVFWPLIVVLFLISLGLVRASLKVKERSVGSKLLVILIGVGILYHRHALNYWRDWRFDAECLGLYLGVGAIVMLAKWLTCLMDFRSIAIKTVVSSMESQKIKETAMKVACDDFFGFSYDTESDRWAILDKGRWKLNWKKFNFSVWWLDWPYFVLGVLYDPFERFVRNVVERCKRFFSWTANLFSVKE